MVDTAKPDSEGEQSDDPMVFLRRWSKELNAALTELRDSGGSDFKEAKMLESELRRLEVALDAGSQQSPIVEQIIVGKSTTGSGGLVGIRYHLLNQS